jgi:putative hemolysin
MPREERGSYLTLGGFVMMQIGGIRVATDSFEAVGLRFEVADMDGKRVNRVVVQSLSPSESENKEEPEPA